MTYTSNISSSHSDNWDYIAQEIQQLQQLNPSIIQQVTEDIIHSDKDFRGIYANLAELIKQFSQGIPIGYYGYGEKIAELIDTIDKDKDDLDGNSDDIRKYLFLLSLSLSELLKGHIRLVGPSRSGKSEFLFKLVVNLTRNYNFSLIWFSTKWEDDKVFFETVFPNYTVISANEIALTRIKQGRFNPLSRIPIKKGRVNPQDCKKLAECLINLIPIKDVSGDTEKFMRDAVTRLSAILELLKYEYGQEANLQQILPLWQILPIGDESYHPLEILLNSPKIPPEVKNRVGNNLKILTQKQLPHEAMVGPTAQQLLDQIESLAPVITANDCPNFSDRLRNHSQSQVLVIDQSDGMNSSMSKGLARLILPLLYEDLVAKCPSDWKAQEMRPVIMVMDEMNSLLGGKSEFSDFLEKSLAKGVLMAFGQQSTAGNPDPHLNAAMSNNTRLQVVFSGCDTHDPVIKDMSTIAGNFPPPLDVNRTEEGYGNNPRLPIDAVASLGALASLVRVKSTLNKERIMWLYQGNPLVPHRHKILELRTSLATQIAQGNSPENVLQLYEQTENLLLQSYGYWSKEDLEVGYASLNLDGISNSYQKTMKAIALENQKQREAMQLEKSRPDFTRQEMIGLSKNLIEWQHKQVEKTEEWLWQSFLSDILPQLKLYHGVRWNRLRYQYPEKPRILFGLWWFICRILKGKNRLDYTAYYWQKIFTEYKYYAEAFGKCNPELWYNGLSILVNWRIGNSNSTSISHRNLADLIRYIQKK